MKKFKTIVMPFVAGFLSTNLLLILIPEYPYFNGWMSCTVFSGVYDYMNAKNKEEE